MMTTKLYPELAYLQASKADLKINMIFMFQVTFPALEERLRTVVEEELPLFSVMSSKTWWLSLTPQNSGNNSASTQDDALL